ncbi:MAG: lysophospholipid acyltransferase family protein [Desulfosalsimonadaceae bacterium]|nr:lysophospholipid acyltransferase family protein [Desulfosalsimonadaceae bacterium]
MKKKTKRAVRHWVVYAGVVVLVGIFQAMPRQWGITLSRTLMRIYYAASRFHRENAIRHLTMALGREKNETEIRRISREVFLHFATAGVDAVRIPVYVRQGIDRLISTRNIHFLDQVRDEGRGFILLTGHFGNWELMGAWVAQKKYHPHVVGTAFSNAKVNQLIVRTRNQAGYVNIERGHATRGIIKALRNGYPVALLIDQDTRSKGVFVDFFGMKAHTPISPAYLAGAFGVPILPLAMRLKKDLTYEIECFEPIRYVHTGDKERDMIATIQKCSDIYEQIIRRHPEQWVWMHRRWRKQPGDACVV